MDIKDVARTTNCSGCRKPVRAEGMFLTCRKCGVAYPVVEGLPNMLLEDAWKLEKAKKSRFLHDLTLGRFWQKV